MDVDHFKQVNDCHGHDAGDQVLLRIVEEMRLGLRETDELARWGGEEFLLLLPQTTVGAAASLAERLCSQLAKARRSTWRRSGLRSPAVSVLRSIAAVKTWMPA
ncbi:MAG: GGDEF domain-containing protein [Chromatiaceae bacterium]|nr:GGDEF domain-containing protein [Chromatiaceae bacterium]